jgi:hypothetical protein
MIRAIEALETFLRRRDWMSSCFPSSFEVLSAPLGRPRRLPRAFAAAKPSFRAFCNQIAFELGKEPKERNHGFGLDIVLPLETDRLFNGHEPHFLLYEAINYLQNLTEAAAKARQLTYDDPITRVQTLEHLEQFRSLGGVLRGALRFHERIHYHPMLLGIVEDGQPLLVEVLSLRGDPQIRNRCHRHAMKRSDWLFL